MPISHTHLESVHTYTWRCTQRDMHIHKCIHICTWTCVQTCTECIYTPMYAHTDKHMQGHAQAHRNICRHACNACRDMYAHTHTQTHTDTLAQTCWLYRCRAAISPRLPAGAQKAAEWEGTGSSGTDSVLSTSDRGPSVPLCEARQASPHGRGRGSEHRF